MRIQNIIYGLTNGGNIEKRIKNTCNKNKFNTIKMKKIQLIVVVLLFTVYNLNAQMGGYGNGGYGGGMNRGGMGNSMNNNSMHNQRQPEKVAEKPEELVEKKMAVLKAKLTLDELQYIAISNLLKDSFKAQGVVMKKETDDSAKQKDVQAIMDTTDRKINEFLNKDQKIIYLTMIEERKNKMQR